MKVEERKSVRRTNKEIEHQEKENKKINALKEKLKISKGRSESPFVRVQDLDSNISKQSSANKEKDNIHQEKQIKDNSKITPLSKEEQKHKTKLSVPEAKTTATKTKSTTKNVKFAQQQKPVKKNIKPIGKDTNKLTTEDTDSCDEEEINAIPLEEALANLEVIYKQVKELDENKKVILNNKAITEISRKLRCKPINEKLKELRKEMRKYEKVRAKHLGILDKLPKDSPLYAFAYNCQYAQRMKKLAQKKIDDEKKCVEAFLNQSDD